MVIDQKPTIRSVFDTKAASLLVKDTKPRMSKISGETVVYVLRTLSAGMWMGSPFLTYPNELQIARP